MIREMKPLEDAYCVWAGNNYSFDGQLQLLTDSTAAGNEHRWIAGGLLFVLEYRISSSSIPSASLIEDEIRVIGPPVDGYTSPLQAANTIVKPFTPKAWGFIFGCILAHVIVKACIAYDYVEAVTPRQCFDRVLFQEQFFAIRNDHIPLNSNKEEEEVLRNRNSFRILIGTMFMGIRSVKLGLYEDVSSA